VTRRLGLDHNPLRRRSDVIEAWLLPAAIAAFLVLGPVLAGLVGLRVHADNAAAQRAEQAWHRVPAVLLRAAPGPMVSDSGADAWLVWTPARWVAGGRARTGVVAAPSGTRAGATVPVWVDRAGAAQPPPLTPADAGNRVALAISFSLAALAAFLAGLALLARRILYRRRLAGWQAAWLAVGPQWSRRG
jgi:hypothetical protein